VFPNSEIKKISYYGEAGPRPAGTVLLVDFVLDGQEPPRSTAVRSSPSPRPSHCWSTARIRIEIDYYWAKLSEGGEEGQCGWLKDRYGVVLASGARRCSGRPDHRPDKERAQRATPAMFGMKKLDVAALYAAADKA